MAALPGRPIKAFPTCPVRCLREAATLMRRGAQPPPRGRALEEVNFAKKILLVGDGAVGKTSLVRRFVHDLFSDRYIVTIGTKTSRKALKLEYDAEDLSVNLQLGIWDILGQKEGARAHELYFKGADGAILVCDLTRPETLASVPEWSKRVEALCGKLPAVLVANKQDAKDERKVGDEEVAEVAKGLGVSWFQASAKTGLNVEAFFHEVGSLLCASLVVKHIEAREAAAAGQGSKKGLGRRAGRSKP